MRSDPPQLRCLQMGWTGSPLVRYTLPKLRPGPVNNDALLKILTLVLSIAALLIAVFGDWLKAQFGWHAKARLAIDVDRKKNASLYHWGWIEDATKISDLATWADPQSADRGRLRLHFLRAKITNESNIAAKSVTVWVKRFERLNSNQKALENVMPLRWTDFWRLVTNRERNTVTGSDTEVAFAVLPEHTSKYCDLCFYYDLSGPKEIGGLRRNWVYLAVRNLPSSSYAIEGSSSYEVELHIAAENAKSITKVITIHVDWNDTNTPVKIHS